MDHRLDLVIAQFQLHNRLFKNVLEGMEEHRSEQPAEMTNHAAWLAGHLVSSRFMMGQIVGLKVQEPHPGLFEHGKGC